jgi:hypothetical protein
MKIALLADIHANWLALQAVIADAVDQGVDLSNKAFWSLGDVIGYGPHPAEALNFLKEHVDPQGWVLGNHEAMLADLVIPGDLEGIPDPNSLMRVVTQKGQGQEIIARGVFMTWDDWRRTNSIPIKTTELTRDCLSQVAELDSFWRENFTLSRKGPLYIHQDGLDYSLVHGGHASQFTRLVYGWHVEILMPQELQYLQERFQASGFPQVQCFAHTHVPSLARANSRKGEKGFEIIPEKVWPQQTYPLDMEYGLVNPGSVGQPRNLDRRACYAILDTIAHTVTFRRVPYDWQETARDLLWKDFPNEVVTRLKTAAAADKETPDDWLEYYREAAGR